ncbi:MAG: FkbM family methyltransferase [Prevotellaceae bacterium]|jgi:FkbM family methyltransferase|nr:FkbM family methyltransferase [Prevotellaceae bacterium]
MLINKEYILSRVNTILKEKGQNQQNAENNQARLFRIKYSMPSWLRKLIFSPYNPVYAVYKMKQYVKSSTSSHYLHPVTVDFLSYCLENDYNFDTDSFFPPEDEVLVREHIDNRINSILSGYVNHKKVCPEECRQFDENLKSNISKSDGAYILSYEGKQFILSAGIFSYTVFGCHYGLKFLPDNIGESLKDKDFLDIGALYGDASVMLLQYKPHRIYAYEPVTLSYQLLNDTIKLQNTDKIYAVKKGIGDKELTSEINIDYTNAGANTILKNISIITNPETETIQITTIDKECEDKKVGLIKMDIEGFEYYAVKGGLETIKRDKPVLLISIYHTGKDFFEIPQMLKSCVPEYKFRYLDIDPHVFITDKILAAYTE